MSKAQFLYKLICFQKKVKMETNKKILIVCPRNVVQGPMVSIFQGSMVGIVQGLMVIIVQGPMGEYISGYNGRYSFVQLIV